MALLPFQSSCFTNKPHLLLHKPLPHIHIKPKFSIVGQDSSSQSSKQTVTNDPIEQPATSSDKKPNPSSGQGFGPAQLPKSNATPTAKKNKGGRERASIIRRSPVEKPAFLDKKSVEEVGKEQTLNESAFLLTWLGLGILILVEGIALAASGFLPEEWDKLFVKYLYPSFTPTVFLFVAGTVVYGVFKYLQNENATNQK